MQFPGVVQKDDVRAGPAAQNAGESEETMHLTMPEKQAPGKKGRLFFLLAPLLAIAALYWWHEAGKLFFEASFVRPLSPLVAARQGRLLSLEASEGQNVRQGQILARFDDAALRLRVLEDSQALAGLALTLPPELLRLPAAPDSDGREESLSRREQRRRQTEGEARSRLEAATDREAQAAVLLSRARLRAASGGVGAEQLALAEADLEAAREEMRAAREEFERLSLTRAESSAEIRRLKEAQLHSGASRVPVESRLAAYEQARLKLAESEAELAAATIRAPHDGRVTAVYVRVGEEIAAGARVLEIMPERSPGFFEGRVTGAQAEKLRAGQRCRLELTDGRATTLEGVVHSLVPAPAGSGKEEAAAMLARVLPLSASQGAPWPEVGARAGVTVLLREQVADLQEAEPATERATEPAAEPATEPAKIKPGRRSAMDGPEDAAGKAAGSAAGEAPGKSAGLSFPVSVQEAAPDALYDALYDAPYDSMHGQGSGPAHDPGPGLAVPPPQPLSVQNPFGGEDPHARPERPAPPPKVKAGGGRSGTAHSGAAAPGAGPQAGRATGNAKANKDILPPMIAPRVLTGSPLPDKGNNPSIVRLGDVAGDKP